jgi:hypothetical protein
LLFEIPLFSFGLVCGNREFIVGFLFFCFLFFVPADYSNSLGADGTQSEAVKQKLTDLIGRV